MEVRNQLERLILGERVSAAPDIPSHAVPADVTLRRGRFVPWLGGLLAGMSGPASAVALGRSIILQPGVRVTPTLLAHELAHVRQWEEVPFFPLRYAWATVRYGYRNNPFEVEARACAAATTAFQPRDQRAEQNG